MLVLTPGIIAVIVICVVAFLAVTVIWGIKAHRKKIEAGKEELIGRIAEVRTALNPRGMVFVEGETWTAFSEDTGIEPGDEVIIQKVEGLKLWVTKKK